MEQSPRSALERRSSEASGALDTPEADSELEESFFDEEDDYDGYDPLAAENDLVDQEEMDDDNPYDTIDYPTMREMPRHMQREAVYTPERMGSATAALESLFDHNPSRRPVLLAIIDLARDGAPSSAIAERVEELQQDNRSVYAPMTLCRMLERAGGLELEMPEVAEEHEDVAEGVEYLQVEERIDPVWHATDDALAVYDALTQGAQFRDIVLDRDSKYLEVYLAVMELIASAPAQLHDVEQLVDTFEVVQHPRRFGGHFIDMLERTDAIAWKDHAWTITGLGTSMLPEVRANVKEAQYA